MSQIFLISDTHFGHKNIIKYCGRPFEDVHEMNEKLTENWNRVVSDDDYVIHLGDFSFGDYQKYLPRLKGRVGLVRGNHDNRIPNDPSGPFLWTIKFWGYEGAYCQHYPPSEIWVPNPELGRRGEPCFFGHIHDKPHTEENAFCVSVERINYRPILWEEAVERLEAGEQQCPKEK